MQAASASAIGGSRTSSRDEFSARQSYYLRISPYLVLPMSLFLDARDVRWMNSHEGQGADSDEETESNDERSGEDGDSRGEKMLGIVLEHLKEVLMGKLLRESVGSTKSTDILAGAAAYDVKLDSTALGAWSGKETVDIFEHPDFRMAFYFQRAAASGVGGGNRHAVLLKVSVFRNKSVIVSQMMWIRLQRLISTSSLCSSFPFQNKRLTFPHMQRRRQRGNAEAADERVAPTLPIPGPMNDQYGSSTSEAVATDIVSGSMAPPPVPKKRKRGAQDAALDPLSDIQIKPDPDAEPEFQPDNAYTDEWGFSAPQSGREQPSQQPDVDANEEEEDKKPRLTVSYRGFRMCVYRGR